MKVLVSLGCILWQPFVHALLSDSLSYSDLSKLVHNTQNGCGLKQYKDHSWLEVEPWNLCFSLSCQSFYWLPIKSRIEIKTLVTVFNTMQSGHPEYLNGNLVPYMCSLNARRSNPDNKILCTVAYDRKVHTCFKQSNSVLHIPLLACETIFSLNYDCLILYPHSARN